MNSMVSMPLPCRIRETNCRMLPSSSMMKASESRRSLAAARPVFAGAGDTAADIDANLTDTDVRTWVHHSAGSVNYRLPEVI